MRGARAAFKVPRVAVVEDDEAARSPREGRRGRTGVGESRSLSTVEIEVSASVGSLGSSSRLNAFCGGGGDSTGAGAEDEATDGCIRADGAALRLRLLISTSVARN